MATPSSPSTSTFPNLDRTTSRNHSRSSSQLSTMGYSASSSSNRLYSPSNSPRINRSRNVSPDRNRIIAFGLGEQAEDDRSSPSGSDDDDERLEARNGLMITPGSPTSLSSSPNKKGKRREADDLLGGHTLTRRVSELSTTEGTGTGAGIGGEPSLAKYIQQKRRQASAPYYSQARTSSIFANAGGTGFTTTTTSSSTTSPMTIKTDESVDDKEETTSNGGGAMGNVRSRSRQSSRRGTVSNLHLGSLPSASDAFFPHDFDSGMVMTPTTEEWRSLGGQLSLLADIRAKDEERLMATDGRRSVLPISNKTSFNSVSTSSSSSSIELDLPTGAGTKTENGLGAVTPPSSSNVGKAFFALDQPQPTTPPAESVKSSFGYQTSRSGFTSSSSVSTSFNDLDHAQAQIRTDQHRNSLTEPIKQSIFTPTHRPQSSADSGMLRPNLTRGSLSTPTGTPNINPSSPSTNQQSIKDGVNKDPFETCSNPIVSITSATKGIEAEGEKTNMAPLDESGNFLGAIDPRSYSAVTGRRSIHSFIIECEAGKGAYGTVQKAREKDAITGQSKGPTVIIKYIIKQRILADCWKKHKILGPIPVEVHVLDHLRRVPYVERQPSRRKENGAFERPVGKPMRRDSATVSLKEGVLTGHPNICGMLDFFEDGEFYYLVMPQAGPPPSNDLFDYVDLHPNGLPASTIHSILTQLCSALDFLHSHNIVHRDIKDENIVLSSTGNVQLIDFGSAAYVKDGKKFDTFSGTLDFAAPEVLRGARYNGKEQDIWALGVLGYVLICGECPFWSPEEAMKGLEIGSRAELALRAKVDAELLMNSNGDSTVGDEIDGITPKVTMEDAVDLVKRCLEVDPNDRPTANWICDHRFLLGPEGWSGRRGWEEAGFESDSEGC